MISRDVKNTAIARLKCNTPVEDVANEFDIPEKLVQEWKNGLSDDNLVQIAANTHVMSKIVSGEILMEPARADEILRAKITETAIDIVSEVSSTAYASDLVKAKTLQICAGTIAVIHTALLAKSKEQTEDILPSNKGLDIFKGLMKY